MRTLFPIDHEAQVPNIPGLTYVRDYIDERPEAELVEQIDAQTWDMSWQRRRQPYGATYSKGDSPPRPIPAWGCSIAARMLREGISNRPFDQMLVNEYLPGQGIAMHVDYAPFDRTVVSLSLLSACVMEFRCVKTKQSTSIVLERRSLLILSNEARFEWQHGIARRKNDRIAGVLVPRSRRLSVTFRLLKREASLEHRD